MYPVLFKIGPIVIHSYGVMIGIAFLAGLFMAVREAKRKGMDTNLVYDFFILALLFGILGGRLGYILFFDLKHYLTHPLHIPAVWMGGMMLYGGIIGGILTALWFTKKHRLGFLRFADTFTPSLIMGQAIGRIGCFLNGDAYGVPTSLPWGLRFPAGSFAAGEFGQSPIHPTQIYELVLDIIIFLVVWKLRKRRSFDGFLFLLYLILYSVARFFVEPFRADSLYIWGTSIRSSQAISAVLIVLSVLVMLYLRRNPNVWIWKKKP